MHQHVTEAEQSLAHARLLHKDPVRRAMTNRAGGSESAFLHVAFDGWREVLQVIWPTEGAADACDEQARQQA